MPAPYTVEARDGRQIAFDVPKGANAEQIRTLAARALKKADPGTTYKRPVLDTELRAKVPKSAQGELTAYKPGLRDRIENNLGNALQGIGVDAGARRFAKRATNALTDLTPVGDAVSADDARAAWQRGDYLAAGGNALMAALGSVPGFGDVGAHAAHSIIAPLFHGSPHNFDKFNMSKIGTGEGAQAYGHGLYFAENRGTAESYRDALSNARLLVDGEPVGEIGKLAGNARGEAARLLALNGTPSMANEVVDRSVAARKNGGYGFWPREAEKIKAEIAALSGKRIETKAGGNLYEVSIDAEPEDFLDWDAPLDERIERRFDGQIAQTYLGRSGLEGMKRALPRADVKDAGGYIKAVERIFGARDASKMLGKSGIPGIRYLDSGSHNTGDGTRNYVVFDDKLIDILGKY